MHRIKALTHQHMIACASWNVTRGVATKVYFIRLVYAVQRHLARSLDRLASPSVLCIYKNLYQIHGSTNSMSMCMLC